MDKKVTLAQLKEVVQEAYDQVKGEYRRQECRLYSLSGKCQQGSLWNQCLPAQRADHPCGRY